MGDRGLGRAGLGRLQRVMEGHVERGDVPGLAWLVARRGEVHAGVAGTVDVDGTTPVRRDTIFRVASMTKAVTAVAALTLLEECRIRLDDPVDDLLPELADRRVLARPDGPIDDTVPAARAITVRDLLTFRLGLGYDFSATGPQPVLDALAELGLPPGPPAPGAMPPPDEWMRRVGQVPLARQPGERWLYHLGSEVLGLLLARAAGEPLDAVLRERVLDPLGMADTGFSVGSDRIDRFGPSYSADPATGERRVYDPVDGQWSAPPAFPSGGGGLVSTVDDWLAFGSMLLAGGAHDGGRVVSRPSVEAMTTNQVDATQVDPTGALGWGFGVGVQVRRTGIARSAGSYGWDGGLGTTWADDPAEDLVGVLLTNQAWTSPVPPAVARDFWTCAYAAIED